MTAVPVLLAEIRAAGAEVALDSGVLRIRIQRGALTTEQREWLSQHRTEIAALLAEPQLTYLHPPLEDAVPLPPPAEPMLEDLDRLQRIVGSADRLAALSARFEYARPPHRWGDFTDALRERDWRARLAALDGELLAEAGGSGR